MRPNWHILLGHGFWWEPRRSSPRIGEARPNFTTIDIGCRLVRRRFHA